MRKATAGPSSGLPVSTIGAATQTVFSLDISLPPWSVNNAGFMVECSLVGKETTTNERCDISNAASFKRLAGVVTQIGGVPAPPYFQADVPLIGCLMGIDFLGNVIHLQATGVAGKIIAWTPYMWVFTGEF